MQKSLFMKRFLWFLVLFAGLATSVSAETKSDHLVWRNELRFGWGDQLFETLMWHNPTSFVTTLPTSYQQTYHENYRHHQHLWLEYQYRFNHWFSLGGMMDMSEVGWDDITRDGKGTVLQTDPNHYFYNLVLMPTVRFTYFHHEYVNLYSSIGLGLNINGGTETNAAQKHTAVGMAVDITAIGVSANYHRWFMAVDLGGLTSFKDKNTVYMACSRIINVSIGARF